MGLDFSAFNEMLLRQNEVVGFCIQYGCEVYIDIVETKPAPITYFYKWRATKMEINPMPQI